MLKTLTTATVLSFLFYSPQGVVAKHNKIAMPMFSEALLLENSCNRIKEILNSPIEGHVDRIACKFKLSNNNPIEISSKTYYKDYHKKPDFRQPKKLSSVKNKKAKISDNISFVEITYTKGNSSVTLVQKDNKDKKRIFEKTIELPASFYV